MPAWAWMGVAVVVAVCAPAIVRTALSRRRTATLRRRFRPEYERVAKAHELLGDTAAEAAAPLLPPEESGGFQRMPAG